MTGIISGLFKRTADPQVGTADALMIVQGGLPKLGTLPWLRSFIGTFSATAPGLIPAVGAGNAVSTNYIGADGLPHVLPGAIVNNFTATTDPGIANDNSAGQGYSTGSLWMNANTGRLFKCRSAATGAARWSLVGLEGQHPGYIAGNYYPLLGPGHVMATGSNQVANQINAYPFFVEEHVTISALNINVSTAVSAINGQIAIYAYNPATGRPGAPMAYLSAEYSMAGIQAWQAITGPGVSGGNLGLEPGWYYAASVVDTTSSTLKVVSIGGAVAPGTGSKLVGTNSSGTTGVQSILAASGGTIGWYWTSAKSGVTFTGGNFAWPDLTNITPSGGAGSAFAVGAQIASVP